MTTRHFLTTCIIYFTLLTSAHGQENSDQDAQFMPEFCVATFLVTGNQAEADTWLGRYEIDRTMVLFVQHNLQLMLDNKEIRGEDITAAVDGCKEARLEEEGNE